MITGFVAVALLLAAAAAATIRPPSTNRATASTGVASLKGSQTDDDKFAGAPGQRSLSDTRR